MIQLLILFISYAICKQCPQITSYFSIIYDDGYIPNAFLQISQTNILIICTNGYQIWDKVNCILPIQAEYTINGMEYIEYSNKILVLSSVGLTASSIDLKTLEMKQLGIIDYNLYYLYYNYYVNNIIFTYTNGYPIIYLGIPNYFYYIDIQIDKDQNMQPDVYPKYIYQQEKFAWYKLEGTSQIYMGKIWYVHIFDYNSDIFYSQLIMITDYLSRRFVFEDTNQTLILSYQSKSVYYNKIESIQDTFYREKGCELCLLAKLRDSIDIITTSLILPVDAKDKPQPIKTNNFNFTWDVVGLALDPFWCANSI
ncbi:hypothetical protein ABPG72_008307 [Tetrahymena utriculariae]